MGEARVVTWIMADRPRRDCISSCGRPRLDTLISRCRAVFWTSRSAEPGGSSLGIAERPGGATWSQIHGTAPICEIGFMMSLAFENPADNQSSAAPIRLASLPGRSFSACLVACLSGSAPSAGLKSRLANVNLARPETDAALQRPLWRHSALFPKIPHSTSQAAV